MPSLVGDPDSTWRLPFSNTRVEPTPRPRRLIFDVPVVAFWVKASGLFCAPVLIVSVCVISAMFCAPISSMSPEPMVARGEGKSAWFFFLMKDPVTTMTSSLCAWAVCGAAMAAARAMAEALTASVLRIKSSLGTAANHFASDIYLLTIPLCIYFRCRQSDCRGFTAIGQKTLNFPECCCTDSTVPMVRRTIRIGLNLYRIKISYGSVNIHGRHRL